MPIIEEFSSDMIRKFLISNGIEYTDLVPGMGTYVVKVRNDDVAFNECEVELWLSELGSRISRYSIIAYSNKKRFSSAYKDLIIQQCNKWNSESNPLNAYYEKDDHEDEWQIILSHTLRVESGIHQELLNEISLEAISRAESFWSEMLYFLSFNTIEGIE